MRWILPLSAAFILHAGYWMLTRRGLRRARQRAPTPRIRDEALPPVSVVVAARNEADRLPTLLDAMLRQTHPTYEIIVVDDASTDATAKVVRAWQQRHDHLRLVQVTRPVAPRKKHALTQGIAAARYERLAFTDADCTPPPSWLRALAAHAHQHPEALLIGYSPFRRQPGLLNRLACYETFVTGVMTAASAGLDRPYMAVGRNLSYPRSLFARIGGFAHSRRSMSGDDDLLVQAVDRQQAAPIYVVLDPDTFVPTEAPSTWRTWLRGKRRHVSAGRFYRWRTLAHLGLFQGSGALLWAAPLLAGWAGVALLGGKLGVQHAVLHEAAARLDEHDLLPGLPLWDLLHTAYLAAITPFGATPPARW
jgi:glycosyltransferase involved in cell wall biosynthesis